MARNCGLRAAEGKFVVFTDDDVSPDPSWLDVLSATFRVACRCCLCERVGPAGVADDRSRAPVPGVRGLPADVRGERIPPVARPGTVEAVPVPSRGSSGPARTWPSAPRRCSRSAGSTWRSVPVLRRAAGEDIDVAVRLLLGRAPHRAPAGGGDLAPLAHDQRRTRRARSRTTAAGSRRRSPSSWRSARSLPMVVRRIPAGLSALLSPNSVKNDQRSSTYPAELRRAEWRGLRAGPLAYRKSRRLARRGEPGWRLRDAGPDPALPLGRQRTIARLRTLERRPDDVRRTPRRRRHARVHATDGQRLRRSPLDARLPDKPCMITFDDGRADFVDGALPALESHRVPGDHVHGVGTHRRDEFVASDARGAGSADARLEGSAPTRPGWHRDRCPLRHPRRARRHRLDRVCGPRSPPRGLG